MMTYPAPVLFNERGEFLSGDSHGRPRGTASISVARADIESSGNCRPYLAFAHPRGVRAHFPCLLP